MKTTRRRGWVRGAAWGVGVVGALAAGGYLAFRLLVVTPAAYVPEWAVTLGVPLLSWAEHDARHDSTPDPYVLRLSAGPGGVGSGEILYIGVRHTRDASDPQLAEIERLWADFRPTVALCEGRARRFVWSGRPTVGELTESELTFALARRDGVACYSLEPPYETEVNRLLDTYPRDAVAAYFTLRGFASESQGRSENPESLALSIMRKRTAVPALNGAVSSIADLDGVWKRVCPEATDWRGIASLDESDYFRGVGDASREVRGRHMIACLLDLARKGERVIAVVGKSHVIRQEPVLRAGCAEMAGTGTAR